MQPIDIQTITNFLTVNAPAESADLAFVFGTSLTIPAIVAARLFHQQVVPYIVVTGGTNPRGIAEAELHANILRDLGVPAEHVLCEEQSTNTFENVEFALPIIQARPALQDVHSIVAVAKWFHCRRALMTLKRFWPTPLRCFTATYEPEQAMRTDWWQHQFGQRVVLKEWEAIPAYRSKGWLHDITWKDGAFE